MNFPLPQLSNGSVERVSDVVRVDILRFTTEDFFIDPLGHCRAINVTYGPVMLRLKDVKICIHGSRAYESFTCSATLNTKMNVRSPATRMKFLLPQLSNGGVECVRYDVRLDKLRVTAKDFLVDPLGDSRAVNVAHEPTMLRLKDIKA